MNYICTWLYADQKGEESKFLQTGEISSSTKHHNIYWRCVITFYASSKFVNKKEKHLFFTNLEKLPVVDGVNMDDFFKKLDIDVISTPLTYKTPKGYYWAYQNTFFEFSILDYMRKNFDKHQDYNFMLLDSDCIFLKPAAPLFMAAEKNNGFLTYLMTYKENSDVNGITRSKMRAIYRELLDESITELPDYHGGELLLVNKENLIKITEDFEYLWPVLLDRHEQGLDKFNTEEHALNYIFHKNGMQGGGANEFLKRIWTNPVFYRNAQETDSTLNIWHLPAEKTFGIERLFKLLKKRDFKISYSKEAYVNFLSAHFGLPKLSSKQRIHYYIHTYTNAISKRIRKKLKQLTA